MKKVLPYVALLLSVFLSACAGPKFKTPVVDGKEFPTDTVKANGENGQLIIARKDIERGIYVVATQARYSKTVDAVLTEIIKARLEKNGIKVVDKVEDAVVVIKFVPFGFVKQDTSNTSGARFGAAIGGILLGNITGVANAIGANGNTISKLSLVGFVDTHPKHDPMSEEFFNGLQQRAKLDADYYANDDIEATKAIKAMTDLWVEAYIKG